MKFAATIWIFYNFQIHKRIVSAETICGNTVDFLLSCQKSDIIFENKLFWKFKYQKMPIIKNVFEFKKYQIDWDFFQMRKKIFRLWVNIRVKIGCLK